MSTCVAWSSIPILLNDRDVLFSLPHFLLVFYRSWQIFIKTLTGRKQAFNFEPENQVLAVKQALQEKEGIQVDQIRLIHSGKQLYVFFFQFLF